ncbi:hypothetical protein BKA70DRAFT_537078 [Coprinopsis sp. MPI-PUGE-AT-0042]|nr:hypothetical protein BKA70DRAFT_537078 [Coprinopsis sp. MPI-PUGE-AT-0042]
MLFSSSKALGLVSALLVLPALTSASYVPRPSNTPGCSWSCPPTGKALQSSKAEYGLLFCKYGSGRSAMDCSYSQSNGNRVSGGNNCPAKAVEITKPRRDTEGVYKAYQEQRDRRAAAPAPTVPNYMQTRAILKKRESKH